MAKSQAGSILGSKGVPKTKSATVARGKIAQGGSMLRPSSTAGVKVNKPNVLSKAGRITGKGTTGTRIQSMVPGDKEKLNNVRKVNSAPSTANVRGGRSNNYHQFLEGFMGTARTLQRLSGRKKRGGKK